MLLTIPLVSSMLAVSSLALSPLSNTPRAAANSSLFANAVQWEHYISETINHLRSEISAGGGGSLEFLSVLAGDAYYFPLGGVIARQTNEREIYADAKYDDGYDLMRKRAETEEVEYPVFEWPLSSVSLSLTGALDIARKRAQAVGMQKPISIVTVSIFEFHYADHSTYYLFRPWDDDIRSAGRSEAVLVSTRAGTRSGLYYEDLEFQRIENPYRHFHDLSSGGNGLNLTELETFGIFPNASRHDFIQTE